MARTPPHRGRLASVPEPSGQRAVAYLRVSAVMGREELHSPDLQLRRIKDLIDRRGLTQVDIVQDIDVSGRHFNRDGIQRILAMARARPRQVDVVALYDLSRLGRNTGESLRVITELRDNGVSVASTVEQIDDSPEGQFMLGQFLGMAQLYSDQMGRRWAETARYRVEQGRFHGSAAPTGYQLVKGEGLRPDPDEAPLVIDAFRRYAAGEPISAIGRAFNRFDGKQRSTAILVIKNVLRNPIYVGRVRLNGQEYPGVHEALVDETLFQKVQDRLRADAVTPSRRLAIAYSTTGLVLCAGCGYHLVHHAASKKKAAKGETARMRCGRHTAFGDCPTDGIGDPQVGEVEAALLVLVAAHLDQLRIDATARATRAAGRARAAADLRRVSRELEQTRAARGRLAVDLARRIVDEGAFKLADHELARAEDRLVETLGDLQISASTAPARQAVIAGRWLLEHWEQMTVQERNRGLKLQMRYVTLRRAESYREPVAQRLAEPEWR
jgi:site-specific DNA recombinase